MEKRKIILFGTNSYIVSLPKTWIDKNKLKKGDSVQISEIDDEIIINLGNEKQEPIELIDINIDKKEIEIIRTEIITAYLRGYNEININGRSLNKNIAKIRSFVTNLPGLEVMDLTSDTMRIKNLLNEWGVSIDEILLRTNNMIISMIKDTILCLDEDIHESIIERDNDVNRMVFLSYRVLRKALKNKSFAKNLKLYPDQIIMLWQIFLRLEKIGDQNKRLARFYIQSKNLNKILIKEIHNDLKQQHSELFNDYYNKKTDKILYIATKGKISIIKKCESLIGKNSDYNTFKIIENFKNMSSSIEHIAQVMLTTI
jgi:phosphate uptake regulator